MPHRCSCAATSGDSSVTPCERTKLPSSASAWTTARQPLTDIDEGMRGEVADPGSLAPHISRSLVSGEGTVRW